MGIRSNGLYSYRRFNHQTDEKCTLDDLKRWLTAYPWVVVLDGLDEFQALSNRKQVLKRLALLDGCLPPCLDAD